VFAGEGPSHRRADGIDGFENGLTIFDGEGKKENRTADTCVEAMSTASMNHLQSLLFDRLKAD